MVFMIWVTHRRRRFTTALKVNLLAPRAVNATDGQVLIYKSDHSLGFTLVLEDTPKTLKMFGLNRCPTCVAFKILIRMLKSARTLSGQEISKRISGVEMSCPSTQFSHATGALKL